MRQLSDIWLKFLIILVVFTAATTVGSWFFAARYEQSETNQPAAAPVATAPPSASTAQPPVKPNENAGNLSLPPEAVPITATVTQSRVVAVTFENNWDCPISPLLLFALSSNNAHATFFCSADWAAANQDTVRQILREGHEIGNDGSQKSYDGKPYEWVKADLQKNANSLRDLIGVPPTLFHPADARSDKAVCRAAAELGYTPIGCSIDSLDRFTDNRALIIGRIMQKVKPGSIISLNITKSSEYGAQTVADLLQRLTAQGYQAVTVGELLKSHSEQGLLRTAE